MLGEVDQRKRPLHRLSGRCVVVQRRSELEVLSRRQAPVEAPLVPRTEPDDTAHGGGAIGDVVPVNRGSPAIRSDERGKDAQERRLPRTVRAHHAVHHAGRNNEVQSAQRMHDFLGATGPPTPHFESLLEVLDLNDGRHGLVSRAVTSARLQLRMATLLVATRLSLRSRDTTATMRHFLRGAKQWREFSDDDALAALRLPARALRANCLAQSIALTVALERSGQQPTLVLGCRRYENREWGAHAWVVVGNRVLDALPSGPHEPLARLAAKNQWVPAPITEQEGLLKESG